mgnify:CR=1 FL=1
MRTNKTVRGVFYRSNGRWTPVRTWTGKVRTFTSDRELGRFLRSSDFNYERNYILKSRVAVRRVTV